MENESAADLLKLKDNSNIELISEKADYSLSKIDEVFDKAHNQSSITIQRNLVSKINTCLNLNDHSLDKSPLSMNDELKVKRKPGHAQTFGLFKIGTEISKEIKDHINNKFGYLRNVSEDEDSVKIVEQPNSMKDSKKENVQVQVIVNVQNININNNINKNKYSKNNAFKAYPSANNIPIENDLINFQIDKVEDNKLEDKKYQSDKNVMRFVKELPNQGRSRARERFRTLFLKLKIILLFKYILAHIKYVGAKTLKMDIREEVQNIEAMNLDMKAASGNVQTKVEKNRCRCTIHPDSKFASVWNFSSLLMLIYTATILPYRTCFVDSTDLFSGYWYIETLMDLLFVLDLILNFFLGYYDADDELVMENSTITMSYLTSWFVMDFISSFPFNYIEYINQDNSNTKVNVTYNKLLKLTRIPRFYRLIRLVKIARSFKIFRKNKFIQHIIKVIKINAGIKRMFVSMSTLIIITHVFACLYYFMAKLDDFGIDTWVMRYNLYDDNDGTKYLFSFYYCIVTTMCVGFGDMVSVTLNERILTCFMILVGMVIYTFNIANLALLISKFDDETSTLELKIHSLNKLAKNVKLRDDTYLRIKRVFEEDSSNYVSYNEDKFLQEIPHNLRVEVIFHINERVIRNIKYFQDKSPFFVSDLIEKWKRIVFDNKQFIYLQGEFPYDIYFIDRGKTAYFDSEGNEISKFNKGATLGEVEPFLAIEERILTLQALSNCEAYYITVEDLGLVISKYYNDLIKTLSFANFKYNNYKNEILENKKERRMNYDKKIEIQIMRNGDKAKGINAIKEVKRREGHEDDKKKSFFDTLRQKDGSIYSDGESNDKVKEIAPTNKFTNFEFGQKKDTQIYSKPFLDLIGKNAKRNSILNVTKKFNRKNNLTDNTRRKSKYIETNLSRVVKDIIESPSYMDEISNYFNFFLKETRKIMESFTDMRVIIRDFSEISEYNSFLLKRIESDVNKLEQKQKMFMSDNKSMWLNEYK